MNLVWTTWPLFVKTLGANTYETGLVWALGYVLDIGLLIPCSMLSDRFGRKKAIVASTLFIIIPNFAYTMCTTWEQLIPFKMIASLRDILYNPAEAAMITDISKPEERGRAYAIVQFAHPILSIPSPLIGAYILDNYGWNAVFYSIIFAALLAIVPALFLTETKGKTERVKAVEAEASPADPSKNSEKRRRIDLSYIYFLAVFLTFTSFRGLEMAFSQITPIYLVEKFNADSFQQGLFFSVGTMVVWLLIILPSGWLADRYNRKKIALVSCITEPIIIIFWPQMGSYNSLLMLRMLLQTSSTLPGPAIQAYLMDYTDPSRRGLAAGIQQMGQTIGGQVVGVTLMGYIYQTYGSTAPFYVGALFGLPGIPLLYLLGRKKSKK